MKTEMGEEELVVDLQKTGKVGGAPVVALLKRETVASPVGAQRSVTMVASRVGACQVVAMTLVGQGASQVGAVTGAGPEEAWWVEGEAAENRGQKEAALTCSPCTGSSGSEMN